MRGRRVRMARIAGAIASVVALSAAALPVPETDAAKLNEGEVSAGLFVSFDGFPAEVVPDGLFRLSADGDGLIRLTLPAAADDLIGDMAFAAKKPVKAGEWHHVAFAFSRQQRRFAFWLDGELQFENNAKWLPRLALGSVKGPAKGGHVRDLRTFDASLTSDCLLPAAERAADLAAAKSDLGTVEAAANGDLRAWGRALAERHAELEGRKGFASARELKELRRDCGNAARIAQALADRPKCRAEGPVVAMTVDPLSQEMYLPYDYPQDGEITGEMNVALAQDEWENGSLLVWPFKPVDRFTVEVSDLACGKETMKGADVDVKVVKRIYCTGGAWSTYHRDPRLRILTPCLLLNDDSLFRVDETKCRNFMRIDYPEGTVYADISDPDAPVQRFGAGIPHNDAKELQPLRLPEAGRNQQYLFTFHAPKGQAPGLYRGEIRLLADGKAVGRVRLAVRVLPFELPKLPKSYDDLSRVFVTQVNHFEMTGTAVTHEDRLRFTRDVLRNAIEHNALNLSGIWSGDGLAALATEYGFDTNYMFSASARWNHDVFWSGTGDWRDLYKGVSVTNLTEAQKREGLRLLRRRAKPTLERFRRWAPGGVPVIGFWSESGSYRRVAEVQRQEAEFAHGLGMKVTADGGAKNLWFASDVQDMESDAGVSSRERAENWHAGGGSIRMYCAPFPSAENPQMYRRWNGFERYKTHHLDGNMLHGFVTSLYDEFRDNAGGDGNYRNFAVAYPQQNALTYTLAWEGWREAIDDVRYATKLKELCTPHLADENLFVRGEARRALVWLDQRDGTFTDLNMLRRGLQWRIANFLDVLAAAGKGKEAGK